jgi:hypothetical protein
MFFRNTHIHQGADQPSGDTSGNRPHPGARYRGKRRR